MIASGIVAAALVAGIAIRGIGDDGGTTSTASDVQPQQAQRRADRPVDLPGLRSEPVAPLPPRAEAVLPAAYCESNGTPPRKLGDPAGERSWTQSTFDGEPPFALRHPRAWTTEIGPDDLAHSVLFHGGPIEMAVFSVAAEGTDLATELEYVASAVEAETDKALITEHVLIGDITACAMHGTTGAYGVDVYFLVHGGRAYGIGVSGPIEQLRSIESVVATFRPAS